MRYSIISGMLIILVAIFFNGCSGNDPSISPVTPQPSMDVPESLMVGVSEKFPDGSPAEGMGALGFFELILDPKNTAAEIAPVRQQSLTDVLEVVDITNFMQLAPCVDCVKIRSVALDPDGNLVVTIGIRHPFPAGDPLKPITGRNRGDLHVFNIEGIVLSDISSLSYPALGEAIAGFHLVNASGYSKYLDSVLEDIFPTNATVHPYILHFNDYSAGNFDPGNPMGFASVTDPPPSGNLVMAMGCDYDYKDYVFDLPETQTTNFIFAVGCTYAVASASKNQRFTPEYRIPQHNKKAASEVSLNIISNDLKDGDTSSTAEIEVRIIDINHGVPVGEALNEMLSDSSVNDIYIEIPGIMTSMLVLDGSTPVSGTGHDPSDPLVYTGTITNTAGATEGSYSGLIKVLDNYAPGQNGSPLLNGMDGIKRVDPLSNPLTGLFEISEFATYQTFTIDVEEGNIPPTGGTISFSWECPGDPCPGFVVTFAISEASDLDGDPLTITWDFDGNLDFADDLDGDDTNLTGEYIFMLPGAYNAWCRIDDGLAFTDIGPFAVTVLDCTPDSPSLLRPPVDSTLAQNGRKCAINPVDGYVYVIQDTGSGGSVSIIDVSDPVLAYEVKAVPLSAWSATIAYYDGYVYAAGQAMQGIKTIDVDPPLDASIVNTWTDWSMTGSMEDMHVESTYLFVAAQWGGFMIFNLVNPSNPILVSNSPTSSSRYTISVMVTPDLKWGFFHEGYSTTTTDRTRILNISNLTSPVVVNTIDMPTFAMDMQVKGNYLFCVSHPWWGRTLAVIDISDPPTASIVKTFTANNGAWDIDLNGDYLYLPGGELTIVDVSDPLNPSTTGNLTIAGDARGVRVHCGIAYVSASDPTLSIVDLY